MIRNLSTHLPLFSYLGAAKLGTDESAFNSILATRSWAHLRQVMAEYQSMHGHTLERAVVSEFSANAEKGLLGICKSRSFDFFKCHPWHKLIFIFCV